MFSFGLTWQVDRVRVRDDSGSFRNLGLVSGKIRKSLPPVYITIISDTLPPDIDIVSSILALARQLTSMNFLNLSEV